MEKNLQESVIARCDFCKIEAEFKKLPNQYFTTINDNERCLYYCNKCGETYQISKLTEIR